MRLTIILFSIIIISIFFNCSCKSQTIINWNEATDWKIYQLRDPSSFKLNTRKLQKFENTKADSLNHFVLNAKRMDSNPLWKGFFITTCKIDGEVRKVIFSVYGGFFYDAKSGQYYEAKEEHRSELRNYLNRKLN